MKHTLLFILMAFAFGSLATAQNNRAMDYDKEWKKIDSLTNKKRLPQSALTEIEKVYNYALNNKDYNQVIKAVLYRMSNQSRVRVGINETIAALKQDAAHLPQPAQSVIYSIIGDAYRSYYQDYRWQIQNRTRADIIDDDVSTWDISRLFEEAIKYYKLSVQNENALQAAPIGNYKDILYNYAELNETMLLPTLYDFLVFRAIKAFGGEMSAALPQQKFVLNKPEFFADVNTFVAYKIETADTLSAEYQVISLYQKLLNFRLKELFLDKISSRIVEENSNRYALVNLDIERLKYVRQKGRYDNNDELYENALKKLLSDTDGKNEWKYPAYALAVLYKEQGDTWRTSKNDSFRNKYNEAYDLCTQIAGKPDSPDNGIKQFAEALCKEIAAPSVQITVQSVQYPNTPILALANYRNVETMYVSVYKVTENFFTGNNRYNTKIADFKNKTLVKQQQIKVSSQADYQTYSAEVMIESLPQGLYAVIVSNTVDLFSDEPDKKPVALTFVQVTPYTALLRKGDEQVFTQSAITGNQTEVYITDSKTGEPVKQAKIEYYSGDWQSDTKGGAGKYIKPLEGTYYTNNEGMAYIPELENRRSFGRAVITKGSSRLVLFNWNSGYWYSNRKGNTFTRTVFFTDRSLYRPGQTVYYKALQFKTNNDGKNTLETKTSLLVSFKDVNRKEIASQTHVTNNYGTIQGSFVIPQGLLNGRMILETPNGSVVIQVEEYKRPTFEVNFDPIKNNYKLNDEVEVTGLAKALAGYAVDNSKVQYRVVRSTEYRWFRWWMPPREDAQREIASGEVITDSKGAFTINFKALADDVKNNDLIYNYTITADVTDVNGETRSATLRMRISNKPLLIVSSIPEKLIAADSMKFDFTTTNLNGDFTPSDVSITITALQSLDANILRARLWAVPDTLAMPRDEFKKHFPYDAYGNENLPSNYKVLNEVSKIAFNTNDSKKVDLFTLKNQKSGWYRFDIKAKNAQGVEVEEQNYVQLTSVTPEPIKSMDQWLQVVKGSGEPGEKAEFLVAGGESKSTVRYEVIFKNNIIEQKTITVGTTPKRITIPIKKEYRGGFVVQFVMVQNGRIYRNMQNVIVPYTNKQLDITFNTFRDKLLPGENEKWTLTVKNKQGEKEMAEMVATLYDASLDEVFRPHVWDNAGYFYPQRSHYILSWTTASYSVINTSYYLNYNPYHAGKFHLVYPQLNPFGGYWISDLYGDYEAERLGTAVVMGYGQKSKIGQSRNAVKKESLDEVPLTNLTAMLQGKSAGLKAVPASGRPGAAASITIRGVGSITEEPQPDITEIATRQNFNETAFFYPQLVTNEDGEIIIEFTIPETLTRWKMLGFAHTKDFKVGNVSNELITQKQVAISANAPRFFRESDVIEFTAKVNNITEGDLNGQAMLRLYDAATMQPIDDKVLKSAAIQNFRAKAGESAGVKWTLNIPAGIQAITYKVTAQAGNHTDGEEKIVPVMTNTILVTETMPFSIRAGQQKEFTFTRLKDNKSKTLRNHKLTLEFTSNPAWYAVQALPYLMEYPYECAEQVFARFYANSLATTIVNSSPRVKQVFDMWSNLPENKDALLSNLEKNEELKQVLLEETPWVMQAQNETERKKRVGLLFDLNRMSGELQRAFTQLKKKQRSNGGFPWFDGLPENRYITQHIIAGIEHLKKLNALTGNFTADADNMVDAGLSYLDYSIKKDYDNLLTSKNIDLSKQYIGAIQIHYLYTCSFSEHKPQNKEQLKAFDYYYGQAAKYWMNFNLNNQAMIALAMKRFGNPSVANDIIRSLKERAQRSDEMGMYWKDNVAGYFWYQAPIETQAILIEAFNEVADDKAAVEDMKIWLLRNKQTNDWRTTKATAEATYALLMTGSNLLDESPIIDVKIGGKPLADIAKTDIRPEPGTGYVKISWNGSDITNQMANLNVTNPNKNGIAWGGMYWQYFEQLDKITSAETSLRMNKQLFLKKITERGAELQPLNEKNVLQVGDVVTVRLELRADRDYEYVHLKDMRAASFEPTKAISGYRYQDGLWYYESIKDASTNFFISSLRKGTYVFEYELRVTHSGEFSNGITTFQCMYAPEFSAHSEGIRVNVE